MLNSLDMTDFACLVTPIYPVEIELVDFRYHPFFSAAVYKL